MTELARQVLVLIVAALAGIIAAWVSMRSNNDGNKR